MKLSPISAAVLSVLAANLAHAESDVYQFEEVVVTANKIEQPLSEVAGSVAVIGGETLEKKGATELYDALKGEPGVSVSGGAGRTQNITIRGMTGNRIVIVKDGVKSSDGFGANDINDKVGRKSFDLANVKSIEVVKGASSSLHGSGAIGGVVILKYKQPGDYLTQSDFYSDVSTTYTGLSNQYKGATNLAFRLGQTESLLNLAYWVGEETRNFDQDLYNRSIDGVNGAYNVNHYVGDELMLKAKVEYYTENLSRKEGAASIQRDGAWEIETFDQQGSTEELSASIGVEYMPLNSWFNELDAQAYWRDTETTEETNRLMRREQNNVIQKRRVIDDRRFFDELLGMDIDLVSSSDFLGVEHDLSYGLMASTNRHKRPSNKTTLDWNGVVDSGISPFSPARSFNTGAYIRDAVPLGKWTLTAGLRIDAHRLTPDEEKQIEGYDVGVVDSSEWSPSASVSYQLTESLNTYVSYNHGYRAPAYDKVYGYTNHDFVPLNPFEIIPNMDLKAETSDAFEIGSKFDNGQTQLYTAVFYQKFKNFIDIKQITSVADPDNGGVYYKQYQNVSGVETYGIELSLAHQINQQWRVASKLGFVDGQDSDGQKVRTLTPWEGNVELSYENQDLTAYSMLNWAQAMSKVPECESTVGITEECATTSGWASVDLGVSYAVNSALDISANVVNLFDKEYIRYQDVAGISDSNKKYSTEPGRYFTVNAKYAF